MDVNNLTHYLGLFLHFYCKTAYLCTYFSQNVNFRVVKRRLLPNAIVLCILIHCCNHVSIVRSNNSLCLVRVCSIHSSAIVSWRSSAMFIIYSLMMWDIITIVCWHFLQNGLTEIVQRSLGWIELREKDDDQSIPWAKRRVVGHQFFSEPTHLHAYTQAHMV